MCPTMQFGLATDSNPFLIAATGQSVLDGITGAHHLSRTACLVFVFVQELSCVHIMSSLL